MLMNVVADGSLLLALPLAALAGLVSFASPCVIPLVPGYLGFITGLAGEELSEGRSGRGRMLLGMALFVAGFSFVFVVLGWTAGWLGGFLQEYATSLTRGLGVVTILLGMLYLGWFPGLAAFEARSHWRPKAGLAAAPILGATFGLSWTACTGPTLAVIINLGLIGADPTRGAILAAAYCVGLGLPFLAAGLMYRRAIGAFAVIREHRVAVTRAGGVMLIGVGLALTLGWWDLWVQSLQGYITGFETWI